MDKLKIVLRAFFDSVRMSLETFILPTGTYLLPAVVISVVILIVTIICKLFDVFTLIDIPGAALGVALLLGICFIERKERNDISNIYRTVASRVSSVVNRKAGTPSDEPVELDGGSSEVCTGGGDLPQLGLGANLCGKPLEGSSGTTGRSSAEIEDYDDQDFS